MDYFVFLKQNSRGLMLYMPVFLFFFKTCVSHFSIIILALQVVWKISETLTLVCNQQILSGAAASTSSVKQ